MSAAGSERRVRLTRTFVQRVAHGKEHPGPWLDTESPLRLKGNKHGASYSVRRKVKGRAATFTPRTPDGTVIENSAGTLSLDEARAWAKALVGRLAQGLPPQVDKSHTTAVTFQQLVEDYLAAYAETHAHSTEAIRTEAQGCSYAARVIGHLRPADIDAEAAQTVKNAFAQSPSSSRKAWGAAKRVLDLAVTKGLAKSNILATMKAPKAPLPRDRYPRLPDLAAIWQACAATQGVGAAIVQFAMAMPLRPNTIASLTWGEADLDAAELRLRPRDGRKFKGEQRLPLPSLAVELLRERKPDDADPNALVYGSDSPKNPGGRFSGWNNAVARIRKRSGVDNWSCHDFRRSAVSLVAEHRPDISEASLDRWLTHAASSTNSGVKAVYQRAAGYRGMRLAADAWDDILRSALASEHTPTTWSQR